MENLESSYYIPSGCVGELLHLSDMYDDHNKKPVFLGICMAFYSHGNNNHVGLKQRARHIFNIVKKGVPWNDELIFDVKSAKEVRDKLTELIEKAEKIHD